MTEVFKKTSIDAKEGVQIVVPFSDIHEKVHPITLQPNIIEPQPEARIPTIEELSQLHETKKRSPKLNIVPPLTLNKQDAADMKQITEKGKKEDETEAANEKIREQQRQEAAKIIIPSNDKEDKIRLENLIEPALLLRPNYEKFTKADLKKLKDKIKLSCREKNYDPHWRYVIEALSMKSQPGESGYVEMTKVLLWACSGLLRRSNDKRCWRWSRSKKLWEEKSIEDIKSVYLPTIYHGVLECLHKYLRSLPEGIKTKTAEDIVSISYHKPIHKKTEALLLEAIYDPKFEDTLNMSDNEIPTLGGVVVNLKDFSVRERTMDDKWSREIGVRFNPSASLDYVTNWINSLFLQDVDNCQEKEQYKEVPEFLQMVLGYMLTGLTKEQKMFFLMGDGSAGKSTLNSLISHILGEDGFYYMIPPSMIMEKNKSQTISSTAPTPDPFYDFLRGKRAVFSSENDEDSVLKMAKVKGMVGEDRISYRRLRENEIKTLIPKYKMFHLCNELPFINIKDYSDIRKFILIHFPASFKPDSRRDMKDPTQRPINTNLKTELMKQENLEAFFLYMCIGSKLYLEYVDKDRNNLEDKIPQILRDKFNYEMDEMSKRKNESEYGDAVVDISELIERFCLDHLVKTNDDNDRIGSTELLLLFNRLHNTNVKSREFGMKLNKCLGQSTKIKINKQPVQGYKNMKYSVKEFIDKNDIEGVKTVDLFANFKKMFKDNSMTKAAFLEVLKDFGVINTSL